MVNQVVLGGQIDNSRWSHKKRGFYVTLKQTRPVAGAKRALTDFFVVYGNPPVAEQLEAHVKQYATLTVQGVLRTYQNERTREWKTVIEVVKIIPASDELRVVNQPSQT